MAKNVLATATGQTVQAALWGFAGGLAVLAALFVFDSLHRQALPMRQPTVATAAPLPRQAEASLPARPVVSPPAPEEKREAALAPPAPAAALPPWLRFAIAAPPIEGRPRIAIVIDDLGLDRARTERTIALAGGVTLSFMTYATDLAHLTEEAHRAGHELLVHVPMEPLNRSLDMGPNGLAVGLPPEELRLRLRWDLDRFGGYVGINNHMGSRFTSDAEGMQLVIEELKARGLLFLDSRTVANSVGAGMARRFGVPYAERDVFLDDVDTEAAVDDRLREVESIARRRGAAIAIGHPRDATLAALAAWLPALAQKGLVLVPLTDIVKSRAMAG